MIYTPLTKKALDLCFTAHKDQRDRSGLPYVFHPFHLAEQMADENTTIAALLHDVVEDTAYTLDDLTDMGFPSPVIQALSLLTHDESEPYMEYVCRIACNPIAKAVKLADLAHNSDLSRLEQVTEKDRARVRKYSIAKQLILSSRMIQPHTNGLGPARHKSRLEINEANHVYFSITATEHEIVQYNIDVELDHDSHCTFSKESACKLSLVMGADISLPERLMEFLKDHKPDEIFDMMDTYYIPAESYFFRELSDFPLEPNL